MATDQTDALSEAQANGVISAGAVPQRILYSALGQGKQLPPFRQKVIVQELNSARLGLGAGKPPPEDHVFDFLRNSKPWPGADETSHYE